MFKLYIPDIYKIYIFLTDLYIRIWESSFSGIKS